MVGPGQRSGLNRPKQAREGGLPSVGIKHGCNRKPGELTAAWLSGTGVSTTGGMNLWSLAIASQNQLARAPGKGPLNDVEDGEWGEYREVGNAKFAY